MRDSFVFFRGFQNAIDVLPDEQQLEVYRCISKFSLDGEIPKETSKTALAIMELIKPVMEANNKRYFASVENGKKGGRPKKEKPKKTQQNLTKPKQNLNVNVNVNDKKENIIINNNIKEKSYEKKYFADDERNNLFLEFLDVRKKVKAVNSELAIKKLINKLNKYSKEEQIQMLDNSIINAWKDVYEVKHKRETQVEKLQREIREAEEEERENEKSRST